MKSVDELIKMKKMGHKRPSPRRQTELDGKSIKAAINPLLECYGRGFTIKQWQHWGAVLGEMKALDLEESIAWWINHRTEFPPSPAAIKSHAFDQVKKDRFGKQQLEVAENLRASGPSPEERLPPEQAQAYCKYIREKIIDKEVKVRAPDDANKARWYENEMEKFFDEQMGDDDEGIKV